MEPLHILWFTLLGVLLAGYAILDGFDLGVGILHLCVRKDGERRLFMNSIGPLWDGNEVWLVVFGGALFAAFPRAYAAAFSGFYTPFMIILAALIFRGVSMEFRGKHDAPAWRAFWDIAFCAASALATFSFGVLVANCILGLPLGADGDFVRAVTLTDLLRPYPVLVGLFAVSTFAMHGSIYLYLKTEGELQQRLHRWMWRTFGLFLALYVLVTIFTLTTIPRSTAKYQEYPWAWIVVVLNVLAIANIPRAIYQGRPFDAFISSSATIAAFTFLFGLTLAPNLIVSTVNPDYSLTVARAASSRKTLQIMTIVACLGMPFVLSYTIVIYWVFRGKVRLDRFSY
ncbi:MAG TPA: cytochrome d ubiquinol oxidase subunit II [Gemmataceae bacterium]|jgi:cytochrome d ubiquinol oxidase subunit II